jgi:hypothetical protein
MQRQCTTMLILQEYESDSDATETAPGKAVPKDGADTDMGQGEVKAVMGAVMGAVAEAEAMEAAEDTANTLAVVEAVDNFGAMEKECAGRKTHKPDAQSCVIPKLKHMEPCMAQSCVTPKLKHMEPCMLQGAAYPSATTPCSLM